MTKPDPFKGFHSSTEIIRLAVMLYVRFPLSLRNVEDLLHDRGIAIRHESVRIWWNRFGPMLAAEIRKKRVERMRSWPHWRWHRDEMFAATHSSVSYHFNQERHLYSRQNFKLNRAVARAEWRQLVSA